MRGGMIRRDKYLGGSVYRGVETQGYSNTKTGKCFIGPRAKMELAEKILRWDRVEFQLVGGVMFALRRKKLVGSY